jgi:hypothetical protein
MMEVMLGKIPKML